MSCGPLVLCGSVMVGSRCTEESTSPQGDLRQSEVLAYVSSMPIPMCRMHWSGRRARADEAARRGGCTSSISAVTTMASNACACSRASSAKASSCPIALLYGPDRRIIAMYASSALQSRFCCSSRSLVARLEPPAEPEPSKLLVMLQTIVVGCRACRSSSKKNPPQQLGSDNGCGLQITLHSVLVERAGLVEDPSRQRRSCRRRAGALRCAGRRASVVRSAERTWRFSTQRIATVHAGG